MNKERLDKLLMSFYDGQTTLEEEKQLMDFFASTTSLDEEYLADRELFIDLGKDWGQVDIPSSLDEKLNGWLVDEARVEAEDIRVVKKRPFTLKRGYLLSIAASFLLLLAGVYFFKAHQSHQESALVAIELNLEESVEVTEQVFFLLSSKLNQSVGAVDKAQEKVNDVSRVMHKLKIK